MSPRRPQFLDGVQPAISAPHQLTGDDKVRAVPWRQAAPPLATAPTSQPAPAVQSPSSLASVHALPPPSSVPPPRPSPPQARFAPPPLSPAVEGAIRELRATAAQLAEQARSDSLEIGLMVARAILEREVTTNIDSLFGLVKAAIRRAGDSTQLAVHLHPDDAARFEAIPQASLSMATVRVVPDPTLERGDVLVQTAHHTVDARLSTRLAEAARELGEAIEDQAA